MSECGGQGGGGGGGVRQGGGGDKSRSLVSVRVWVGKPPTGIPAFTG